MNHSGDVCGCGGGEICGMTSDDSRRKTRRELVCATMGVIVGLVLRVGDVGALIVSRGRCGAPTDADLAPVNSRDAIRNSASSSNLVTLRVAERCNLVVGDPDLITVETVFCSGAGGASSDFFLRSDRRIITDLISFVVKVSLRRFSFSRRFGGLETEIGSEISGRFLSSLVEVSFESEDFADQDSCRRCLLLLSFFLF
jgi:hypothetical protein